MTECHPARGHRCSGRRAVIGNSPELAIFLAVSGPPSTPVAGSASRGFCEASRRFRRNSHSKAHGKVREDLHEGVLVQLAKARGTVALLEEKQPNNLVVLVCDERVDTR